MDLSHTTSEVRDFSRNLQLFPCRAL